MNVNGEGQNIQISDAPPGDAPPGDAPHGNGQGDMREFMVVVRQALLLIVAWIERRYGLRRPPMTDTNVWQPIVRAAGRRVDGK